MVPGEVQGKLRLSCWAIRQFNDHSATWKLIVRMGGLLIADAARDIAKNTRAGDKLWPHIVALIGAPISSSRSNNC